MKKKAIIITVCVAVTVLIAVTIVLAIALKKDYIEEIKYDHVSEYSYNGVSIVGDDGLFYLSRDGKHISQGYVFLKSVNDYYGNIEELGAKNESDLVLFDYYIAHRQDSASYYLVTSTGEEYMITGDNYSLESVALPYLIFINNTTSKKAAISLLKIDSDLSYKSGNDITLKPFSELYPIDDGKHVLRTHLYTADESAQKQHSLFCDDGTLIVSAENLELAVFEENDEQSAVYIVDIDENTVYSSRGELLSKGDEPLKKISELYGYAVRHDDKLGVNVIDIFSARGVHTLTDIEYDISAPETYNGALLLPYREGGYAVVSVLDGNRILCESAEKREDGIISAKLSDTEYAYLDGCGNTLIRTEYSDLVLDTVLSYGECYVFISEAYRADKGNVNAYHFTHSEHASTTMNFEDSESISLLSANAGDGETSSGYVEGSFLLSKTEDGRTTYRLCTPFAANPLSDIFDGVNTYLQAGIYWSRCVSYDRGVYDIIDPISNQKAGSILCEGETFASLSFGYEAYSFMVPDIYDEKSGIPLLLLSITSYADDEGTTDSVRYYALYRSANYSSDSFDDGTLRISEIGLNLLRSEPYRFFENDNCLVLNGIGSSKVFRFNDSKVLAEAASMPYSVTDIMYDKSDPSLIYYKVETEGGKQGLYDNDGTQILAPYYDGIYSLESGRFAVSLRGGIGVLEYKNEKLIQVIDYAYSKIEDLSDGGYIMTDGNGNSFLFEKDNVILKKPIQSNKQLVEYSVAEDGTLQIRYNTLISCDGRLYIHKGEAVYRARCTDRETPEVTYTDIDNTRAILVRYHEAGRVTAEDIIYPTEYYRAMFEVQASPENEGWYFSDDTEKQTASVTKEEILTAAEHIVDLYAKEKAK